MGLLLLMGSGGRSILDRYTATIAFSLRKIRDSYGGSAIRVRRSSDSTEQNIGFNGYDLDTSALTSFVGAGDGFVTTWYDQVGGNNAVQATGASQPLIVSGGTIQTEAGKPCIVFGLDKTLVTGTVENITRPFTWICARRVQVDDSEMIASIPYRLQQIAGGNAVRVRGSAGSGASLASAGNTFSIFTGQIQSSPNARIRRNGGSFTSSTGYTETPTASTLTLNRANAAARSNHCESIYFNSEISDAAISAIETNMNQYWGAY